MVSPVTKSAWPEARKQMTFAWSTELVGELPRQSDDATLGRGVGRRAGRALPSARDRGEVDDLAAPLALHDWDDGMREEIRPRQVEVDQRRPLGERQLLRGGGGLGDDRAAAHGIDQDVDPPKMLNGVG